MDAGFAGMIMFIFGMLVPMFMIDVMRLVKDRGFEHIVVVLYVISFLAGLVIVMYYLHEHLLLFITGLILGLLIPPIVEMMIRKGS